MVRETVWGEVEGLGGQGPHGKGDSLGGRGRDLEVKVPMVRKTVWGQGPHGLCREGADYL